MDEEKIKADAKSDGENNTSIHSNGMARDIDINNVDIMYDASIKEVLANRQILARILKYSLSEFADEDIDEIISWMDEPLVSKVDVDPGMTNNESQSEKVLRLQQEDNVYGEGFIRYDIRFNIFHHRIQNKFLINVEAQKSSDRGSLNYYIDNRMIFYISRMVSAQKETEFRNSDYDNIKPVKSIWICMDAKEGEESISRIKYIQEPVYGNPVELANIDKPQGVIIRIKNGKSIEKTQNKLINMLEELIRDEDAETKKRNLSREYGIVMNEKIEGQVNTMCNWSEAIEERAREKWMEKGLAEGLEKGIEQGLEQGLELGIEKNTRDVVFRMLKLGRYTYEEIATVSSISVEDVRALERKDRGEEEC